MNERQAQRVGRPIADRFAEKYTVAPSGCWKWHAAKDGHGYGQLRIGGKNKLATHISLELAGHPRPDGACALHKCDNPPCVNPNHLWWGSRKENHQDALRKQRLDLRGLALGRTIATPLPKVPCTACGVVFKTSKWRFEKNVNHFCCTTCCRDWQRARYTGKPRATWAR